MASSSRSRGERARDAARWTGSQRPDSRRALSSGSHPSDSSSALTVSHVGAVRPRSMRLTAAWVVPALRASERWLRPAARDGGGSSLQAD